MAPGLRGRGAPGGRRKCFARNFVTLRKRIAGRVSAAGGVAAAPEPSGRQLHRRVHVSLALPVTAMERLAAPEIRAGIALQPQH